MVENFIAPVLVGIIVGYLLPLLSPKSKLVWWSPHNFRFDLKDQKVLLETNSLTVQNLGRSNAEDVEIIHQQKPDFFELYPAVKYEESVAPNGNHVIKIGSLGAQEWVIVQMLSYKTPPVFLNIRSKNGPAKNIAIQITRLWPRAVYLVIAALLLTGVGTVCYFCLKLIRLVLS